MAPSDHWPPTTPSHYYVTMWRKVFDLLFWLAVSVYFGGMLTLGAIAAPAIFSTAHDAQLSMPKIVAPPLDMGNQVGGEVFGVILNRFAYVEYACLVVLAGAIAGWFKFKRPAGYATWVIALLWVGLAGLVGYDAVAVRPAVFKQREAVRNTAAAHVTTAPVETSTSAATPAPWPEKAEFDVLHKRSEDVGRYKAYLLFGMILVAAFYGQNGKQATLTPSAEPPPRKRPTPMDP